MTPDAAAPQWWSATATWRLLRCPVSAASAQAPTNPPSKAADNAGTLAHLALQAWAESGEWSRPEPGVRLQERFDEVAAARGANPERMPQALVTRARLKSRGKELAAILSCAGADIRSELLLNDENNHLFGILDIAATGASGLVIDLKTGRDGSAEPSPTIEHQMTFYAHLFQATYGMRPEHVVIFSLQHGAAEIEVTSSMISVLLEQVRAARLSASAIARPQQDTCRFCPKRMTCQPHWDALPTWDRPDAIEGAISKIEHSSSGKTALRIGSQWLTGIPAISIPGGAEPGEFARVVHVRRRYERTPDEWAASSNTRIQIYPAL